MDYQVFTKKTEAWYFQDSTCGVVLTLKLTLKQATSFCKPSEGRRIWYNLTVTADEVGRNFKNLIYQLLLDLCSFEVKSWSFELLPQPYSYSSIH